MSGTEATGPTSDPGAAAGRTLELRRGEASPQELAKLETLGAGFEAIFTSPLLGELLKPLQGAGIAGEGPGASVVQGLIETNLSDHLSKSGALGIGRMIVETMKPLLAAQRVSAQELGEKAHAAGKAAAQEEAR